MKITDALMAEHGELYNTLSFVEEVAPTLETRELQLLASMLERLLRVHAELEENYILAALDHTLEEKGQRNRIRQVHQEIDSRLKEIHRVSELAQALRLLREAIDVSRKHFKYEEDIVFPLAETVLKPETLETLGKALFDQRRKCR